MRSAAFIRRAVLWLLLLPLLFACREPASMEFFVQREDAQEGVYPFLLDLSDSLRRYDICLYGRMDGSNDELLSQRVFPLSLTLVSPSGERYGERIWIETRRDSYFSAGFYTPWRQEIAPREFGEWRLLLAAPDSLTTLQGLGVILSHKNKEDGTR